MEHGDILQLEHHVGMFLKWFLGCLFIVLGGDADDDTTLLEFLHPHLELGKGLADAQSMPQLDTLYSVITDNTSPDRIVKIEDETFLKLSLDCADDIHHSSSHIRQGVDA